MSKILITGATGHFGKAVINALVQRNSNDSIVALVREQSRGAELQAKGVEIRIGDYNNKASLEQAFQGIDKVLFVSGSDTTTRNQQHKNVVDAMKAAGVKHAVYTSFQRKNESADSPIAFVAESHMNTEKWLAESGIAYTILQNAVYMDMLPYFVGENVLETGAIYLPAGDGKASFATRQDMAEAAANVVSSDAHENKVYLFANTTAYSFQDVADVLSDISGKQINYISPSQEEYKDTLSKYGVPVEFIGMFAGFAEAIKQGELQEPSTDLEILLGRPPVSLQEYLHSVYNK